MIIQLASICLLFKLVLSHYELVVSNISVNGYAKTNSEKLRTY